MKLDEVHFLLSYQCISECDHCFVWSSPSAEGHMDISQIRSALSDMKSIGTVRSVLFEGGEPFLFYPVLLMGVREARTHGLRTCVLSNGYWATSVENAREWLVPLREAGLDRLDLSSDYYHGVKSEPGKVSNAVRAATDLTIPVAVLSTLGFTRRERADPKADFTGAKRERWYIMCRGRAASTLISKRRKKRWGTLDECPYKNLADPQGAYTLAEPGRVHLDPYGYVYVCEGIAIGNAQAKPISQIIADYNPEAHPIIGPLLRGGPRALAEKYKLRHAKAYTDACHFCYDARAKLRKRFPQVLAPSQMYGAA